MDKASLVQRTRGIAVFTVTPFTPEGRVDGAGVRRNTQYLVEAGIPVAVMCGGVGELWDLSLDEHRQVVEAAVEAAQGRLAVYAGVCGDGPASVTQAEQAQKAGADGVLLFPDDDVVPDRPSLIDYYTRVSESVDIGLMPFRADAWVDIDTLGRIADLPNVVALKEELERMDDFRQIVLALGDRMTIIGAGDAFAPCYFVLGAGGLACGLSNFLPHLYVEMWDAAQRWDYARVMEIHTRLEAFTALRQQHGTALLKTALELIGLSGGPCRGGRASLTEAERDQVKSALQDFGLLR